MQSVDADTVIWITVLPSTSHIRIVDRQYLNDTLTGLVCPVNHHLQVSEITYTEATLTSQGEDGDNRSCTLPWINIKVRW